jgi:hypothetical protein
MINFQQFVLALSLALVNGDTQACLPSNQCPYRDCCCAKVNSNTNDVAITCEQNMNKFPDRNPAFSSASASTSTFMQLTIRNPKFATLPSKAFDGLHIQKIRLENNGLTTIKSDSFNGLRGFYELRFVRQDITRVEHNALNAIKDNLGFLEINNCTLATINSILIGYKFSNLSELFLTMNKLQTLNPNWFNSAPNISSLDLSFNDQLVVYPTTESGGFFTQHPNLNTIKLTDNQISNFESVALWLWNVREQIVTLDVSSNRLARIPSELNSFPNLSRLVLSKNMLDETITEMTLRNLTKLELLFVNSNRLKSEKNAFVNNPNLILVYFEENEFEEIPEFSNEIRNMNFYNQRGHLSELNDFQFDLRSLFLYVDIGMFI